MVVRRRGRKIYLNYFIDHLTFIVAEIDNLLFLSYSIFSNLSDSFMFLLLTEFLLILPSAVTEFLLT